MIFPFQQINNSCPLCKAVIQFILFSGQRLEVFAKEEESDYYDYDYDYDDDDAISHLDDEADDGLNEVRR